AMELLSMMKQQGRRILLVSNAQHCYTANELTKLKLTDLFDDIFISSDFHVCKPDPFLWHTVICASGIRPEESLMIGNDYECDILSARKAGLNGLYINTGISPQDDLNRLPACERVYDDLSEITEYLLEY
ncbi:MAG: HAD family hydrolase, partial [Erysipelotrichaceae bacterium]|nr:HAD family hydrolase [Erysipelotrichaceae bacterium]